MRGIFYIQLPQQSVCVCVYIYIYSTAGFIPQERPLGSQKGPGGQREGKGGQQEKVARGLVWLTSCTDSIETRTKVDGPTKPTYIGHWLDQS